MIDTQDSDRGRSWLGHAAFVLFAFRVQVFVTAVIAFALWTGAIRDVLTVTAVDKPQQAVVLIGLLAITTVMLLVTGEASRRATFDVAPSPSSTIVSWIPVLLAIVPALAVMNASLTIYDSGMNVDGGVIDGRLAVAAGAAIVVLLALADHLWLGASASLAQRLAASPRPKARGWIEFLPLLMLFAIGVALSLPFFLSDLLWTQDIGAVSIILWWGAAASALFVPLALLGQARRIPILFLLFAAALGFSGFDLNDNHEIGGHGDPRDANAPPLSDPFNNAPPSFSLAEWLESRGDKDDYEQYPVFIIATEGGASRASYYTGELLSAFQDRCPAFAQHVIAISSVSGGSVGASVFAALSADMAKNSQHDGCDPSGAASAFRDRSRAVLAKDLLSPTIASLMFPDALQRILWFPVPGFDRGLALERAFVSSWREAAVGCCDADRMSADFQALYDPKDKEPSGEGKKANAAPWLFMNATGVGTGVAQPLSPVRLMEEGFFMSSGSTIGVSPYSPERIQDTALVDRSIRLGTAAIMSARFPLISPAASIRNGSTKYRFVDGGYFEASGTWAAENLLQALLFQQREYSESDSGLTQAQRVRLANAVFFILLINAEECVDAKGAVDKCRASPAQFQEKTSFGEIFSVGRAFLNARVTRARVAKTSLAKLGLTVAEVCQTGIHWMVEAAPELQKSGPYPVNCSAAWVPPDTGGIVLPHVTVAEIQLSRDTVAIPMNWVLSDAARDAIHRSVAKSTSVDLKTAWGGGAVTPAIVNVNSFAAVLCALHLRKGVDASPYEKCKEFN